MSESNASPMELVIKHNMTLDVGHACISATVYDEHLSETFEFTESFNLMSEKRSAIKKAVKRAAEKADSIKRNWGKT